MFSPRMKKIAILVSALLGICLLAIPQLRADDTSTTTTSTTTPAATSTAAASGSAGVGGEGSAITALLQQIAQYTNGTLTALTSLSNPVVNALIIALSNITAADNATNPATPTPALQNAFTTYTSTAASSTAADLALQNGLVANLLGADATTKTFPNANDVSFPTLLGQLYFTPDPRVNSGGPAVNPAYNYLLNVSGLNITHTMPASNWRGAIYDQQRYGSFYNTISAVQTLNGYLLSQYYSDLNSGVPATQTTLVNLASDPTNWFATITSEPIGAVLRQLLMFQSQSYILLTQLLQTEKQLLAAESANNTLLILANMSNESMIVRKAITSSGG